MSVGGELGVMYVVLSGVLQGCPSSRILFALIMEPFLNMFLVQIVTPGCGHIRACADDVGAVTRDFKSITVPVQVFDCANVVAGLQLKLSKCVLVLLHRPCAIMSRA